MKTIKIVLMVLAISSCVTLPEESINNKIDSTKVLLQTMDKYYKLGLNDIGKQGIYGNISEYTDEIKLYNEMTNKLDFNSKIKYIFDVSGNFTEIYNYDISNEIQSKLIYEYIDNILIKINTYDNNNVLNTTEELIYNDSRFHVGSIYYNNKGQIKLKSEILYGVGNDYNITFYDSKGNESGQIIYQYQGNNLIMSRYSWITDGIKYYSHSSFKYLNNDRIEEDLTIKKYDTYRTTNVKYVFDEYGNWLEKYEYIERDNHSKKGNLYSTTLRQIK